MEPNTPDWDQTKDILHALLEQPPEARGRLLREACGADLHLRAEVESLLAAHENAGHFAERPALQVLADADDSPDVHELSPLLLQPGDRLGPYEVQACLGMGGMGEVYRAVDTRLQRLVAVKVLRSLAAGSEHRERFEREARVIARLRHPHICVLHDVGNEGGLAYLVMEHLDGETLAERLGRGPLPAEQAIRYAMDIADALAETHRNGIVHRDIKPSNIMLTSSGAKLLDFGVAKQLVMAALASDGAAAAEGLPGQWSSVFGTPLYMAPEQLCGGEIDHRTDIFAFGAVLYEMVTGRKAFHIDGSLIESLSAREKQAPAMAVEGSALLQKIDDVVQRCLATDPGNRWQSAGDVRQALSEAREEPRAWRVPLAAAALVMSALVVWGIVRPGDSGDSEQVLPPVVAEAQAPTPGAGSAAPTPAASDSESRAQDARPRETAAGRSDDNALLRLARQARERGDLEGALQSLREAKAARPDDPEIDKEIGELLSAVQAVVGRLRELQAPQPSSLITGGAAGRRLGPAYRAADAVAEAEKLAQRARPLDAIRAYLMAKVFLEAAITPAPTTAGGAVNAPGNSSPAIVAQQGDAASSPVTALIVDVSGKQVILNRGTTAGIRVGDRLIVQRVSRTITDPATGRVLRTLISPTIGTLRVVSVDDESSLADVLTGSDLRIGDAVALAPTTRGGAVNGDASPAREALQDVLGR